MLKLLPLVMGTILALSVSLLVAYIIYLFSMKSDAQSKIEKEGYTISGILETYSSQSFFAFSNVGRDIMIPYLEKNPEATELDLVDLILKDLGDYDKEEQVHELFTNHIDDGMPYTGRIYIYSLDQYIQALFPPGMHMKGRGYSYSYPYRYNKAEGQSKWLFPYGPNGMNQWLIEYERIKSAVNISKRMSGNYSKDISEYVRLNQDKAFIKRNNYQYWIVQCIQVIDNLEEPVRRIHSLRKLIDIYSIEKRLPNLRTTGIFLILAFFCGVFLPLLLVGLGIIEKEYVPLNLSLLFITFLFTLLAGYYLFKDLSPQKETIRTKVSLTELRDNLVHIRIGVEYTNVARYAYINNLLEGVYKENIPKDYREKLYSLSNGLSDYNDSIQSLSEIIKSKILGSEMLSSNILEEGGGGKDVQIMTILRNDDFAKFFEKNMIWVFNLGRDDYKLETFRLQVPKKDEDFSKFLMEIDDIRSELLKENKEINNIKEILALMDELLKSLESEVN